MTDDVYAHGFRKWNARFETHTRPGEIFGTQPTRETAIAASAYREAHGDGLATALDLGAGDGRNTIFLAQQGFDVTAVDAAPAGVELIRGALAERSLAATLLVEDLRTYTLPTDVDLLLASYVIHLLPEPYQQIKAWGDAVRPGGLCVVSTRGRFEDDPAGLWFPEPFELKRLFEDAGWFILHAHEEDTWRPQLNVLFRGRAVVARKPR